MKKRDAYIHIGTPKTGTTALQMLLTSNFSILKKRGYLYPKTGLWARGHSDAHHNLAYQLYNSPFFDPEHGTLEQLRNELKMWDGHVIISSEIFVGLYNNVAKLSMLKDTFNSCGLNVIIVIYFRDCIEYVNYLYAEFVKNHFLSIDINEFVDHIIKFGQFALYDNWEFSIDYFKIIKNFGDIFGNENIILRKYKSANTINSFSKIIDVDLGSEIIINRDDNPKTIELLKELNKILTGSSLDETIHANLNQTIAIKLKDFNNKKLFGISDKNIKILKGANDMLNKIKIGNF